MTKTDKPVGRFGEMVERALAKKDKKSRARPIRPGTSGDAVAAKPTAR